jgi:transposase-like protein
METPKTLQEAIIHFSDDANCQRFMIAMRWPDGKVRCPRCDSERVTYLAKQRRWKCYGNHPRPQFSLKVGTIFEDSPLGLDKWLTAMWLLSSAKNGVSSCELARSLGITQKSAWHVLHRVRLAMRQGTFGKLAGEVEVDETFIGGKARNMHIAVKKRRITGTGGKDKAKVMGMLERGGKVRTVVIETRKKHELHANVREHVQAGAALYSDELRSYNGLEGDYAHQVINHSVKYVEENVHTNGMENYWSLLKRGINGTYVSVEPFHLFRYLDEQSFRYNNRKDTDGQRFAEAVRLIVGKRLEYKRLIGKPSC